ncbi:MAG: hypothetical protein L7F77_07730 [Candidatus Magnetominusculus sp. LBB02]|nr:hypothetical protein [Candidatus Magnetominusculus sp. LBB02]
MAGTNLFLLLAETGLSNQWMRLNEYQDELSLNQYVHELSVNLEKITIENYIGYFDEVNRLNFIKHYNMDDFPYAPITLLKRLLRDWENWRDAPQQSSDKEYKIFNQTIENHTFCEIIERRANDHENNYALLNHHAYKIRDKNILITIDGIAVEFSNLADKHSLIQWFASNRIPSRIFNPHVKHKKQPKKDEAVWGKDASVLECSENEAQILLNSAIGDPENILYNYDKSYKKYIVFRRESANERSITYHGYHVALDSADVPQPIKNRFDNRN